jgi:phosphonate degradation associated HDIG domain protein
MKISDQIIDLFEQRGNGAYFGESISETEHALQAAFFAQQESAPKHLVVAALLHDVGHLLHNQGENIADLGIDAEHEEVGERWLAQFFGPEVSEPVKLHVAAKRYLCATRPEYLAALSPTSTRSLQLQGGPMSPVEQLAFERNPHFQEALRLRLWDDRAKIVGLSVPALRHYTDLLNEAACQQLLNQQ